MVNIAVLISGGGTNLQSLIDNINNGYEYGQIKKVSNITVDELITNDSFISDDTILTVAIIVDNC